MIRIALKYLGIEVTHPVVYSLNQDTGTGFTSREDIKKISKSLKPIKNMYTRNRQIYVYKTSVLEFLGGVKTELKNLETICWHYSDLVVSKNFKLKVTSSKLTKSIIRSIFERYNWVQYSRHIYLNNSFRGFINIFIIIHHVVKRKHHIWFSIWCLLIFNIYMGGAGLKTTLKDRDELSIHLHSFKRSLPKH